MTILRKLALVFLALVVWLVNYHFIHIVYRLTGVNIVLY